MKDATSTVVHTIVEKDNCKIIRRDYSGVIKIEDILGSFSYIKENLLEDNTKGLVSDFTNAEFGMNILELPKVFVFFKQNPVFKKLPHAVIVDTPEKTIFPFIAKNKIKSLPIKAFSSLKAGLNWICNQ